MTVMKEPEDLTPRQIELLKAIIAEYTETGEPVGSDILDKKYNMGVSPATIRNEMVTLAKNGYLRKEYFSAGRVPTAQAFRFYIGNLMHEKELSTAEEVSHKSAVWDFRHELHQLLQHATQSLAHRTHMLSVAATDKGDVYYFGVNHILRQKEFSDLERARNLFEPFESFGFCDNIMKRFQQIEDEILYMFAEEERDMSDNIAYVFSRFESPEVKGTIGVMGPRRMRYDVVVPNVKYFSQLIESIIEKE